MAEQSGNITDDQTSNEVHDWYRYKWVKLKAEDDNTRKKISDAIAACADKNVGYDQPNRYGLDKDEMDKLKMHLIQERIRNNYGRLWSNNRAR